MNDQLTLLDEFPAELHARRTDPSTSHIAADSVARVTIRSVHRAQIELLSMLDLGGTHEELWERYEYARRTREDWPKCSVSGFRTRVSELVTLNLVKDSGARRQLQSGRWAIVWSLTAAGWEFS